MCRSNWEELPKHQTLDELDTVNYQVTVTNTGSRSGAIAVLAYMTFSVSLKCSGKVSKPASRLQLGLNRCMAIQLQV